MAHFPASYVSLPEFSIAFHRLPLRHPLSRNVSTGSKGPVLGFNMAEPELSDSATSILFKLACSLGTNENQRGLEWLYPKNPKKCWPFFRDTHQFWHVFVLMNKMLPWLIFHEILALTVMVWFWRYLIPFFLGDPWDSPHLSPNMLCPKNVWGNKIYQSKSSQTGQTVKVIIKLVLTCSNKYY